MEPSQRISDYQRTALRKEAIREDAEQELLIKELKDKGHQCIEVCEKFPIRVTWCEQEPCQNINPYDEHKCINKERKLFAKKLMEEGHKCVKIKESMLIKVSWCRNDLCSVE